MLEHSFYYFYEKALSINNLLVNLEWLSDWSLTMQIMTSTHYGEKSHYCILYFSHAIAIKYMYNVIMSEKLPIKTSYF